MTGQPRSVEELRNVGEAESRASENSRPMLEIDSPPLDKMTALWSMAKATNAGSVFLICRDRDGKVLSASIYAEYEDAESLVQWIEGRTEDTASTPATSETTELPK
jgi:hypothetical protein